MRRSAKAIARSAVLALGGAASAAAGSLQSDDVVLVCFGCSGVNTSSVEVYRPSTGARVFGSQGGTPDCWEGATALPVGFATARKWPAGVNLFDDAGQQTSTFPTPQVTTPGEIAVFSDGTLAVVDLSGDIEVYSPLGHHLYGIAHPSVVKPWGVHVDTSDVLWVADRVTSQPTTGAIARFDKSGTLLGSFPLPIECDELVAAPDGTVWALSPFDGATYHFTATGTLLSSFPVFGPGKLAYGLAILSDGTLVFAAGAEPRLELRDPTGAVLGQIPLAPTCATPHRLDVVRVPQWLDVGSGIAGVAGAPHLDASGSLTAGAVTQLDLSLAAPNAPCALVVGAQRIDAPLFGGVIVPSPDVLLQPLSTGPGGTWTFAGVWPAGIPAGTKLWFQAWIPDAASPQGYAASQGLEATTP